MYSSAKQRQARWRRGRILICLIVGFSIGGLTSYLGPSRSKLSSKYHRHDRRLQLPGEFDHHSHTGEDASAYADHHSHAAVDPISSALESDTPTIQYINSKTISAGDSVTGPPPPTGIQEIHGHIHDESDSHAGVPPAPAHNSVFESLLKGIQMGHQKPSAIRTEHSSSGDSMHLMDENAHSSDLPGHRADSGTAGLMEELKDSDKAIEDAEINGEHASATSHLMDAAGGLEHHDFEVGSHSIDADHESLHGAAALSHDAPPAPTSQSTTDEDHQHGTDVTSDIHSSGEQEATVQSRCGSAARAGSAVQHSAPLACNAAAAHRPRCRLLTMAHISVSAVHQIRSVDPAVPRSEAVPQPAIILTLPQALQSKAPVFKSSCFLPKPAVPTTRTTFLYMKPSQALSVVYD